MTLNKPPFWIDQKDSAYKRDIEKFNQVDGTLGQLNDLSCSYEPYKNKRAIFNKEIHLKKRKELTGVTLPALEHLFQ